MSEVQVTPSSPSEPSAPVTEGQPPAEGQESAKPLTASQKEKFKLTVDGEEFEEEIDFSDKEGLKKRFQLAAAAKKRMSEAGDAKKKAYEIVKAFEDDPESMLARLGPKGREIAEKYLLRQIQDEMLSPEEKEMRMTKAELQKYKEQEAKAKEHQEKSVQEKREMEYAQSFQNTIITALNASGLPKTPELVKRMASTMHKNLQLGLELTPADLVSEVRSDISALLKSIIGDSDGEQLLGLFGSDVANKIRKSDLKKLQEKQSSVFQRGASQKETNQTSRPERGYQTPDEWKAEIEKRVKS